MIEMEECPKCHLEGRRKTLARYEDGHAYCFYCSYYDAGNGSDPRVYFNKDEDAAIRLPYDCEPTLPVVARDWLQKYGITRKESLFLNCMWSPSNQYLVFPFYSETKELLAWQARDFKENPKYKWFSQGDLSDLLLIYGVFGERTVVLVEDVLSAVKVSRHANALCLFGSTPKKDVIIRASRFYKDFAIWLDPDANKSALRISKICNLLDCTSRIIVTSQDPKEHSDSEIKKYLLTEA